MLQGTHLGGGTAETRAKPLWLKDPRRHNWVLSLRDSAVHESWFRRESSVFSMCRDEKSVHSGG